MDLSSLCDSMSVYLAVSMREVERKEAREKMSKQHPTAHTASTVVPCSTVIKTNPKSAKQKLQQTTFYFFYFIFRRK